MKYTIQKADDVLVLRTEHFMPDRGSVLHSGIYNREFTSALAGFVLAGTVYLLLVMNFRKSLFFHLLFIAVFMAGAYGLRKYVFKDRYLEAIFDRAAGRIEIYFAGITRKRKDTILIRDIENILIEQKKSELDNPDGAKFVEKIGLHHGIVMPGFSEDKIFFLLALKLSDGSDRVIYADDNMQDVMAAHAEIKEFLKI